MLGPAAIAALLILVVNDHVLKGTAPTGLTGILSGFAGVVLLPHVLVAFSEVIAVARGTWRGPTGLALAAACLATGLGYALVELVPAGADLYRVGWGILQWPAAALMALASGASPPSLVPVQAVSDPLDLLALLALAIPWWVGRRRIGASELGAAPVRM
jgi:hypothetical protein